MPPITFHRLKKYLNVFATGALLRTQLGALIALPQTPIWVWGREGRNGSGDNGGKEREGRKERDELNWASLKKFLRGI